MNFFDELLELLFPNVCGFCGKISKDGLCDECLKTIKPMLEYKISQNFIYIMPYEGVFRDKILLYKFKGTSYLYKTFSKIILINEKICQILKTYDIIIPVPIHNKRKKQRGYNQSALIAKEVAKNIGSLKYQEVLRKIKNNPKQSLLSREERVKNVKDAYEALNKEIIDKKVILFDDIYTTGATAYECARVLKENGAKDVLILTLARAKEKS